MQNKTDLSSLITARKPVWIALSQLFIISEYQDSPETIARTLAASSYTIDEIDAILRYELTPALRANLSIFAWPGDAFDEAWLVKKLTPRINRQPWFSFGLPKAIQADWQQVKQYLAIYRHKN
ncbi:MAG: hypothetical protein WBP46_04450 [Thiolinea sp.]